MKDLLRCLATVVALALTHTVTLASTNHSTTAYAPPPNDECATATALVFQPAGPCTSPTAGTLREATASAGPGACLGAANNDVWFQFVATAGGAEVILSNVRNGDGDLVHAIYAGACGGLTQLVCSDPNLSTVGGLTVGQIYYVRVHTFDNVAATTDFNICVRALSPIPANDDCSSAIPLILSDDAACMAAVDGTTFGATRSVESNLCSSSSNDDDVWYSFTAPVTAKYLFALSNTIVQTYIHVYQGTCGSPLTRVNTCFTPNSTQPNLIGGQTYLIQVHTASPSLRTDFRLCVRQVIPPPTNDDCSGAVSVFVTENNGCANTIFGTLEGATASGNNSACDGTENDDVWYSFEANSTAVDISLLNVRGNIRDVVHSVYGGTCASLVQLACTDEPNSSTVTDLTVGEEYFIRVNTWTSAEGSNTTFDLCLSQASVTTLPVAFAELSATTTGKSNQLTWVTASEQNARFHYLERSVSDVAGWGTIARLDAAGDSYEPTVYQVNDESPLPSALYRVRSVDYDGYETFSSLLQVDRMDAALASLEVYPNPVHQSVTFELLADAERATTVTLLNSVGSTVLTKTLITKIGRNKIEHDLSALPAGIYVAAIQYGELLFTRRVIKR